GRASGNVSATLVDGGLTVDLRWERSSALLRAGVGLRVGGGVLDGSPGEGHLGARIAGVLWGPQAGAGAEFRPLRWLSLGAGVDGGWWVPELEGLVVGEAPVRIGGAFGAGWVSVGVRW
ncbi:MAG: hypothetical protein JNK82_28180, partial [Myxococcaceae bacterium]|nr:hypothetical protein [Myxococcaceae bacterium]